MTQPCSLDIQPLTPALGGEVFGVDLSKQLTPSEVEAIRRALIAHQVIFFRNQQITFEQHIRLAQRFGSLHVHPLAQANHPDHPELLRIHADENSERAAGEDWHTDVSCEEEPPMGSILHLTEVPASGGDTMFASMYAAYDALSGPMQQFLERLSAVHDGAKVWTKYGMKPSRPFARNEHPVVAVHPETGGLPTNGFSQTTPVLAPLQGTPRALLSDPFPTAGGPARRAACSRPGAGRRPARVQSRRRRSR